MVLGAAKSKIEVSADGMLSCPNYMSWPLGLNAHLSISIVGPPHNLVYT